MLLPVNEASALAAQRVAARARLGVHHVSGRTRLLRLSEEGAAKIRMPAVITDPLQAVLINTAGGLTGGDRIAWEIEAAAGTSVSVTTQACEKVYRALSGEARAAVRLSADTGARIAWLPQETIVYDRSAFARRLDVDLAQGAQLLLAEATVFGRLAMGERVRHATFRDRWRVRLDGRLVHAEDFRIGPDIEATLGRPAVAGGGAAFATALLISPDAGMFLAQARDMIGDAGGASVWTAERIWQASCEDRGRERIFAQAAPRPAAGPAQWTGRPAQDLVGLGIVA